MAAAGYLYLVNGFTQGLAFGRNTSLIPPNRISLPRKGCRVGLRIVLFEDCSAFTRVFIILITSPDVVRA